MCLCKMRLSSLDLLAHAGYDVVQRKLDQMASAADKCPIALLESVPHCPFMIRDGCEDVCGFQPNPCQQLFRFGSVPLSILGRVQADSSDADIPALHRRRHPVYKQHVIVLFEFSFGLPGIT